VAGSFPLPKENGADATWTGFEGVSSADNQNILVFWAQQEVDGYLDNSTCGTVDDISVECTDNGAADLTPNLVNNFVNDPRATSFQVGVANAGADFAVDLSEYGPIYNVSSGHGDVAVTGDAVSVDFSAHNGQLSYFGFEGAAGNSQF